jgi:hypothetical protein
LLAVDEAGFLEEFIWYAGQKRLGEPAAKWLAENASRIESFLSWAKANGYLASESAEEQKGSDETEERSLPFQVFLAAEQSKLVYTMGFLAEGDAQDYSEKESKRFRKRLDLRGNDQVTAQDAKKVLSNPNALTNAEPLLTVFRMHLPGDPEWQRAVDLPKRFGLYFRDLTPKTPFPVSEKQGKGEILVGVQSDQEAWLSYALAKAVWRFEPGFAAQFGVEKNDRPSVAEELFAWSNLVEAYVNSRDPGPDEEDPLPNDSYLDQVLAIEQQGDLLGFVLFEVVHKIYGVPLNNLSPRQKEALNTYVLNNVLPSSAKQ